MKSSQMWGFALLFDVVVDKYDTWGSTKCAYELSLSFAERVLTAATPAPCLQTRGVGDTVHVAVVNIVVFVHLWASSSLWNWSSNWERLEKKL